jgi:hypothetical protein
MKGAPLNSWIKFEKALANDPRVAQMSAHFRNAISNGSVTHDRLDLLATLGALTVLWGIADTHIAEDNTLNCGADQINQIVGVAGFAQILPSNWLQILDPNRVHLPNFLEHNGIEAKKNAVNARRQARHRERHKDTVTPNVRKNNVKSNATVTPIALPDQDQDLYTEKTTPLPPIDLDSAAWSTWLAYRKQIRKPLKDASQAQAQIELAKFGKDQLAVVNQSIAAGWLGLFDLKTNGHAPALQPAPAAVLRDSAEWSELLAAGRAEGLGEPYRLETPQAYAERLRGFRAKLRPKIDTSALTNKLRTLL